MAMQHEKLTKMVDSRATRDVAVLELRSEDIQQLSIRVRMADVEMVSHKSVSGHSARLLMNGVWGFASSEGSADLSRTIRSARAASKSVRAGDRKQLTELAEVKPVDKRVVSKAKIPLDSVDTGDKVEYLKSICSRVADADERIRTCWADYSEVTGERTLVTSDGSVVEFQVAEVDLRATASASEGGIQASAKDEVATVLTGWEHYMREEPSEKIANRLSRKVLNQLDGVGCKRGSYPCLLGPKVVGMLAHEALGHLSEADLFCTGAFNGMEGSEVAPENVTMVDTPRMKGGFGNVEVDDEGVMPNEVVLIDKGILGGQLVDREWAHRLGCKPTGNARAETFRKPPMIRMRNTLFKKGDHDTEELFEKVRNGYYCGDVKGGQAESDSSFQVGIQECFEIRNGELGRPVRDLAISGIAVDSLKRISGVGKDFGYESSYCGKYDQYMATTDGGPSMSIAKGAVVFGGA